MPTHKQELIRSLRLHPSGVPIYVQLRDQLLAAIGAGALAPGEQMPTMREIAVAVRIDLNTVRRAYDELERLGVVALERGRGSFVRAGPPPSEIHDREARLDGLARQAMAMAQAAGVDPAALAERLGRLISERES
jgi:GntR family transcriptional regulator